MNAKQNPDVARDAIRAMTREDLELLAEGLDSLVGLANIVFVVNSGTTLHQAARDNIEAGSIRKDKKEGVEFALNWIEKRAREFWKSETERN